MATTADYLTQLQADKQTLVDNLVAKGVEASNDETFTTLAPKVADIPSGGSDEEWDTSVDFVDIDGELLYHYTQSEIQALEELPLPPEHEYLEFTNWNWSLEELKEWGKGMVVGAVYKTIDGDTKILITVNEPTEVDMYCVIATNGYIDWGDGSRDEINRTSNAHDYHTYQEAGDYVISIGGEKNVRISNNNYNVDGFIPKNIVNNVYVGDNHYLGSLTNEDFDNIKTLVLPETCTWDNSNGLQPQGYNNLKAIIAPKSTIRRVSSYGYSLKYLSVPKYSAGIFVSYTAFLERLTPAYLAEKSVKHDWDYISLNSLPRLKELDASNYKSDKCITIDECRNLTKFAQHPENPTPSLAITGIKDINLTYPYSDNTTYTDLNNNAFVKIKIPNAYTKTPLLKQNYFLEEIELEENVSEVVGSFVYDCHSLKMIKGFENLKKVGSSAFYKTYFPIDDISNLEEISSSAFSYAYGLKKAVFNELITEIPSSVCSGATFLKEVILPQGLLAIKSSAFPSTMIREITIPPLVNNIEQYAFNTSSLEKVEFTSDENLLTIGANNFPYVKSIKIPNSVQSIGNGFYGHKLKNINIPRDCTNIGTYFCNKPKVLEVDATKCNQVPTLGSNAFSEAVKSTGSLTIKVPSSLYDEWVSATNWSVFADDIVAVEVE